MYVCIYVCSLSYVSILLMLSMLSILCLCCFVSYCTALCVHMTSMERMFICLSVCLSVGASGCLSICRSVRICVCVSAFALSILGRLAVPTYICLWAGRLAAR